MVINKDGLITENQNTAVEENINKKKVQKNEDLTYNFDLKGNNQIIYNLSNNKNDQEDLNFKALNSDTNTIQKNNLDEYENNYRNNYNFTNSEQPNNLNEFNRTSEITNKDDTLVKDSQIGLTSEIKDELDSELNSNERETVETNCLALTVRKDYNFSIAKNTVFKTIRMSIKVAISTFVLNLIKLFF